MDLISDKKMDDDTDGKITFGDSKSSTAEEWNASEVGDAESSKPTSQERKLLQDDTRVYQSSFGADVAYNTETAITSEGDEAADNVAGPSETVSAVSEATNNGDDPNYGTLFMCLFPFGFSNAYHSLLSFFCSKCH